jgi:hypothetical protein
LKADPGIENCGQPIGDEIKEKKEKAVDQNNTGNEKYISIHDPTDKKLPNSWNGKNFFDDQAPSENTGGERTSISDEGEHCGAKCVKKDECLFGNSFGTTGTDKVGPDRFQETGSG